MYLCVFHSEDVSLRAPRLGEVRTGVTCPVVVSVNPTAIGFPIPKQHRNNCTTVTTYYSGIRHNILCSKRPPACKSRPRGD